MISESELNKIAKVGRLSQECIAENQFADIVTYELMDLFDSRSAVFMEFDRSDGSESLTSCVSYGIDDLHGARYIEKYHKLDPCYQQLEGLVGSHPQSSVSTDQVIESEHAYSNSQYYKDFMRATGVHRSLVFTLACNAPPVGLIGLHRSKKKYDYKPSDHLKAQLIAPYLYTAVLFRQKERENKRQRLLKNSILKSSNINGYLLFNQNLVCVESVNTAPSDSSRTKVDFEHALRKHCEDLVSSDLASKVKNAFINLGVQSDQLSHEFDNLVQSEHIRVELIIESEKAYVLLLFLNREIEIVCEQRMNYFKLTGRQKNIVKLVQLGFTNTLISERLNISAKTVENHLTQIYSKTFTHNKTSLLTQLHV